MVLPGMRIWLFLLFASLSLYLPVLSCTSLGYGREQGIPGREAPSVTGEQPAVSQPASLPAVPLPAVTAPAGSLLRVRVQGATLCRYLGESWEPISEDCYFPLDLMARGRTVLEIAAAPKGRAPGSVTLLLEIRDPEYGVQEVTVSRRFAELSSQDLRRVEEENRRIAELWRVRTPRRYRLPLSPPLNPLPEGGGFGKRRIINGEERLPHSGMDYSAPEGTPVYAVEDGIVLLTGSFFFSGNSIFIDHGDGLISMYFHLHRIAVQEGEKVKRGQRIGEVGSSGRATGPHLHFALRFRGQRVDPRYFLEEIPPLVLSPPS